LSRVLEKNKLLSTAVSENVTGVRETLLEERIL
jgi:hypothetical protein